LPEVFAGFDRESYDVPVRYPLPAILRPGPQAPFPICSRRY
jgi:hypothetical protein